MPLHELDALLACLAPRQPWAVLSGAGLSTASGIPDYRDAQGAWKRAAPIHHQDFMAHAATRQRYWARSLIGWPVFRQARPNAAHQALARLEAAGQVGVVITQNVDGLHQAAGSQAVIDLHGRLDTTVCMGCGRRSPRAAFQAELLAANGSWHHLQAPVAPDGDADLSGVDFSRFTVPACPHCGGVIKPDVVFYGDNVPRERVDRAMAALRGCEALLVVGSSLMVYSGLRFVHAAQARAPRMAIAAINLGTTRADGLFDAKLHAACAPALQALQAALTR
ncbi:NAD-dependent deacetylase [Comamonas serinivorans]|uniref:NAD-dependent protein deacetylase n=1 Tax=Comamonas serinivorans TaxID=1082851 RepID=A0A1Y0EU83_9BURK|nr:NAD-dependent deacetylase [Comamonas serinivorans]